jgi:hypothetical protein
LRRFRIPEITLGFLFATAIWVVVLWFVADPQTYHQVCETNQQTGKESCAPHNVFYVVSWYAGYWLTASAAAITALATGFIAWFTWTLRQSTEKMWVETQKAADASKQSADVAERALTELEAPFIAVEIAENGIIRKFSGMGHDFQAIRFCVVNYGRTPAQLIEIADLPALRKKTDGLPPAASPDKATRNTMPYGVIAPPTGKSQPFTNNLFAYLLGTNILTTEQLPLKEHTFFFYGFVRYATIFGEVFRVGFCYQFDLFSEKWLLTGDEKYNYCKKERKVTLPNGTQVYRSYDTDNIPPRIRERMASYRRRLIDDLLERFPDIED